MGKMIEYVHTYYGSHYEKYMIIDIENGDVKNQRIISNEEYLKERKNYRYE